MTLPQGWEEAPLFTYLELVSSGVKQFQGTKKYIDTGSLETGRIRDGVDVDYATRPSRANMEVQEGDVLFAKMKDTEKVYLITKDDIDHLYSTGFAILRIKDKSKLLPKYIYFWLRTTDFQRLKNKESIGATQKAINETKLKNFEITVPPTKIQKRIIAILEKAEQIKNWRKEADALIKDYANSLFINMFGDPIKNPKKWPLKKISEFGEWQSGGTPSRLKSHYFEGDLDWYSAGELNTIYVYDSNERITEDAIKNSAAKIIPKDSLLLGMYDTAALKSSITTKKCSCNQAIAFSSLENKNVNILYLYYSIQIGKEIYLSQRRGVRQKNLNLTMIRDLQVPYPPLPLQNKFAGIIDKIQKIESDQISASRISDDLFNSLMQKAFKGELV